MLVQQGTVGQPGQLVVVRQLLDPGGGLLLLGDVFLERQVVGDFPGGVAHRVDQHGLREFLAGLAKADQFALPGLAPGDLGGDAEHGRFRHAGRPQVHRAASQQFLVGVAAQAAVGLVDVLDTVGRVEDHDGHRALRHRQGELAQHLLAFVALRDVPGNDDIAVILARPGRLARHGQLEPAGVRANPQAEDPAARDPLPAGFAERREDRVGGLRGQDVRDQPAFQAGPGQGRPHVLGGMHVQVAALRVHFDHQVGQGIQRRLQALPGFFQHGVGMLDGFHEDGPVQVEIGQHLVAVPEQVVDVHGAHVARHEEFALGHDAGGREQRTGVEAAGTAHEPQQPDGRQQVQGDDPVFDADRERGRPPARNIGGRQPRRRAEGQDRHPEDQQQDERLPAAQGHPDRTDPPGQPDRGQQAQRAHQPGDQPEIGASRVRTGDDEIRHAVQGQHMQEIQQRHRQEGTRQPQEIGRQVFVARTPDDPEDQGRHHDGQGFQRHVQRQEIADVAGGGRQAQGRDHDQDHQQRAGGAEGAAGFRQMGRMDGHGRCSWNVQTNVTGRHPIGKPGPTRIAARASGGPPGRGQPSSVSPMPHQRRVPDRCVRTACAASSSRPASTASMIRRCSSMAGMMRSGSSRRDCCSTVMRS
ncbi:hypothetical protein CDEN61S_00190 [Castellaniella denitrificans]